MAELFSRDYFLFWWLALAAALFLPVRQLIWVLSVRRAERDGQEDEERRQRLKRRANVTAALLVFVFSFFYIGILFRNAP
ncbi:MAG: hypothetical protein D6826_05075 [Alphaproteobacteria bacterium]|nr:MAG: hypothetical protein D6826_05075 [Alphaproteobacteria bacterium]